MKRAVLFLSIGLLLLTGVSSALAADISMSEYFQMSIDVTQEEIKYLKKKIGLIGSFSSSSENLKNELAKLDVEMIRNQDEVYSLYAMTFQDAEEYRRQNRDFFESYLETNLKVKDRYSAVKGALLSLDNKFRKLVADKGIDLKTDLAVAQK